MDDLDAKLTEEAELEAQLEAIQTRLEAVRASNRADVVADVKAKIKRYQITRTELAAAFPVLRKSKTDAAATTTKRTRKPKAQVTDSTS